MGMNIKFFNSSVVTMGILLLLAGSCKKQDDIPVEKDPFKVIAITQLTDHFPYQKLGNGKILFERINDPDGTNLTELASVSAYKSPVPYGNLHRYVSLCWSPDGTKILFTVPIEEYGCHLFLINADGSGLTQVTDNIKA